MKNIMELNVNNLAEEQYNYLKEHTIKILKDIINDLNDDDLQSIKRKICFRNIIDGGLHVHFIDFSYQDNVDINNVMDIYDIIEKMEELKKIFY